MYTMGKSTTIRVSLETRDLLRRMSTKGQTYDEVIRGALELYGALLAELESALHDPGSEWVDEKTLLKELGISEKEIEREMKRLDESDR
jgi:mevalonate kinase